MKPLQKSVTAQDVESCLYYVHLDSPEDEALLESDTVQPSYTAEQSVIVVGSSNTGSVRRKPLPAAPRPASRINMKPAFGAHPSYGGRLDQTSHLSTDIPVAPASSASSYGPTPEAMPYPQGPRPMHPRSHTSGSGLPSPDPTDYSRYREWGSECSNLARPELPPRPSQRNSDIRRSFAESVDDTQEFYGDASPQNTPRFGQDRNSWFIRETSMGNGDRNTSLTLIRRYDGIQSNVGKILQECNQRNGSPKSTSPTKSNFPSSHSTVIELPTAGYSRFAESELGHSLQSKPVQDSGLSNQPTSNNGRLSSANAADKPSIFRRQLHTTLNRKRPQLQPLPDANDASSAYLRPGSSPDMRRHSQQTIGASDLSVPTSPISSELTPSTSKGHTFETPWHSFCEFRTGIAGRSLKCTHTPASIGRSSKTSIPVSELRFNLPSSSALGPPRSQSSADTSTNSKRSSIFSHHSRGKSTSDVPMPSPYAGKVELEDRIDLTLGRERAGGGFGGKHAKLGKLIVEEEGLKMLDLVVAANIALVSCYLYLRSSLSLYYKARDSLWEPSL